MFSKFKKLCCRTADVIDNSYPENEINIMKDDNIERPDQYQIISLLGTGGTSNVYKIKNLKTGKFYTCKKMPLSKKRRAYREVTVLKKINNSYFPTFRKLFIEDNKLHIITDYIEGVELFDMIHACLEFNLITKKNALKYINYMANCVKALHDSGFVHLDIKLENFVLVNKDPLILKLIDFGTAHPICDTLKRLDITVGTRGYTGLEIYRGQYNKKSDVWSLGVCLWILLTSQHAYNHREVPRRCTEDEFPFHKFYFPNEYHLSKKEDIGENLFNLLNKMLSPLPNSRCSIEYVLEKVKKLLQNSLINT